MSERSTPARKLVSGLLTTSGECLTAEEIYSRLGLSGQKVGLATVYRSVNFLSANGAIRRVDVGDGTARFEAAERTSEDHHHHLVCLRCHRVIKYAHFSSEELELMKKTRRALETRFGYRISGHRVYFEGICPDCQKTEQ